jgi:precorrin-2 dehydrogenase/sirohydrochlorin ferrochelatase
MRPKKPPETTLFPIFLKLCGRRCVIVGGGRVGTQKTAALLEAGACVTVIDPSPSEEARALKLSGAILLFERPYASSDLDGAYLVIAATSKLELNQQVVADAHARGALVNVVDVPELCDFYYPAVVRRGPLAIAISSQGKSPLLAQRLRDEISHQLSHNIGAAAVRIGAERLRILKQHPPGPKRARLLRDLVYPATSKAASADA